jgi:hypothetical protein
MKTNARRHKPDVGPVIQFVTATNCPSGKRLYPNRKEAKAAARRIGVTGGADRLDAYRCRTGCDGFHIGHHRRAS